VKLRKIGHTPTTLRNKKKRQIQALRHILHDVVAQQTKRARVNATHSTAQHYFTTKLSPPPHLSCECVSNDSMKSRHSEERLAATSSGMSRNCSQRRIFLQVITGSSE
jgi:hypothetical protein